ncbi:MAG: hypothetical protein ABR587_12065, partial [Candidatus Binatia bacterium]
MMTFSRSQPNELFRFLARVSAGRRVRHCLTVLVAFTFLLAGSTQAWSRDRILIVGNSFTKGIKSDLRNLARSALRDVSVSVRGRAGATLNDHAVSRSTLRKLRIPGWHSVVLQDQSDGIDEERYPGARVLDAEIAAIGADTIFFMTWADQDDEIEVYDELRGVPGGTEGYVPIAMELDAVVAPIGWAFRELLLEGPDAELWRQDGHHAGDRGRYLAALVLYAVIYRESPVGLWATPR